MKNYDWFVSTLLVVIVQLTKGAASLTDLLLPSLALLPFMLFLLAVMLPIQLKFGSEKGRIVLIGVIGLIVLLGVLAVKAAEALHIDLAFFFNSLSSLSMSALIFGAIAVMLLLLLLSLKISMAVMNRKEF